MENIDNQIPQGEESTEEPSLKENNKSKSPLRCCKFSFKTIILCFGILLLAFIAFQFYQTKTLKPISCGGDFNYNVKCPTGTYCKSLGQGPLAGGICSPFLFTLPDQTKLKNPYQTPQKETSPSPTPITNTSNTSTPAEIGASWKTYTNEKYGFKFEHPNLDDSCCAISGPLTGNADTVITFADAKTGRQGTDAPFNGFSVSIEQNLNKLSIAEYISSEENALANNQFCGDISTKESFSIGTLTGTQLSCKNNLGKMFIFPFPDNQRIMIINRGEIEQGSFNNIFDQILSTFRFASP